MVCNHRLHFCFLVGEEQSRGSLLHGLSDPRWGSSVPRWGSSVSVHGLSGHTHLSPVSERSLKAAILETGLRAFYLRR